MKKRTMEYLLGIINILIFVAIIYTLLNKSHETETSLKNDTREINRYPLIVDISKNETWFDVGEASMRAYASMATDIVLYNPIGNESANYVIRYPFHCPSDERRIEYINLYFTKDGVWVHSPYDCAQYTIGVYPETVFIYPVSAEEYFVKWEDFSALVDKITQRHKGCYYYANLYMANDCTIAEHFSYYKLLLDRFPDEWPLYFCRYPGAVIPGVAIDYSPEEKNTSKDIDRLIESLILLLEDDENSEESKLQYLELTKRLSILSRLRYDEVRASISKYAKRLEKAYCNNPNKSLNIIP